MSHGYILWCSHRTGSSVLDLLLKSMSELPDADGEPFDLGGQFAPVGHMDRLTELQLICAERWTIRHIFYQLPLPFNLRLARASTAARYRHIHLDRDPVARIVSQHIAEHLGTWLPGKETQERFARCDMLPPLDVARHQRLCARAQSDWRAIRAELSPLYEVRYEELFCGPLERRRSALRDLARYLDLDFTRWNDSRINSYLIGGGQNSGAVWRAVPNISELREALR
jgi:hypothetical protein